MCGVVGISGQGPVIGEIVDALGLIQHRGQDAAGVATFDGQVLRHLRRRGLVRDVLEHLNFERHRGHEGIGHVRYPTIGGGGVEDAQPFVVNSPFGIAMAHNGNLTNFKPLREELKIECRRYVGSNCDVEVILNVFADELDRKLNGHHVADPTDAIFDAVEGTFGRCRGSYSVVTLVAGVGLLVFRDPYGIKPLIYGKRPDNGGWRYMVASESCALVSLGYEVVADIQAGQAILFAEGKEPLVRQLRESNSHLCIFEFIYFARPDSEIDSISVYKARLRLGAALAKQFEERDAGVDVVIPVPDSSRPAAQEMAFKLKKPYREGLLKNRYIGRTFIMAGDEKRKQGIRFKLAPVRLEIEGKRVLLVDDSIVRGHTSKQIIKMVRETGARQVHMASSCPPLRFPCVYGIDMSTKREFVAQGRNEQEIADIIQADTLVYQRIEDMVSSVRVPGEGDERNFCMACMDGNYPTGDITPEVLSEIENERLAAAVAPDDG